MTDDQTLASLGAATMPSTLESIGAGGTEFTNAVVTTPLCCPSRATMLTGQYAHNHAQHPGYEDLRDKRNTLPVWLHRAGYVTAHVGKYLNGYGQPPTGRATSPRAGTSGTRCSTPGGSFATTATSSPSTAS